jgi:membrane protein required for colicin V production
MNVVDIAILVILTAFLVKGLVRGLLKELCSLIGLLGGAVLAFIFHASLADLLVQSLRIPSTVAVVAAFLAIFLTTILVFAVLGYLLSRFVNLLFLGGLNRLAGGFFGLAEGVVLLAVILYALSLSPLPEVLRPAFKARNCRRRLWVWARRPITAVAGSFRCSRTVEPLTIFDTQ